AAAGAAAAGAGLDEPPPPLPEEGEVGKEVREEGIAPRPRLVLTEDPLGMGLREAVRYVLAVPTNVRLIVASALGYFFFAGLRTFAVEFLRGRYGLGQSAASTLFVVVGLGSVAGVLVAGRLADRMIAHRRIDGRVVVTAGAFLVSAAFFVPGLLTGSLLVAVPLLLVAAAGLGGANPPLDAARLDIMHSRLWGRAEAVRTFFRSALVAIAPLVFGIVSTDLGGRQGGGLGRGSGAVAAGAPGLDRTFLVMLAPQAVAGLILLRARRTYPRDVATAIASEQATRGRSAGTELRAPG
ncbi:MAG: MFS transporter, partial [Acidimicrobiales bacterium]